MGSAGVLSWLVSTWEDEGGRGWKAEQGAVRESLFYEEGKNKHPPGSAKPFSALSWEEPPCLCAVFDAFIVIIVTVT